MERRRCSVNYTLEDELNTRVPLLLKTKLTSILQPHNVKSMGSIAFRLY